MWTQSLLEPNGPPFGRSPQRQGTLQERTFTRVEKSKCNKSKWEPNEKSLGVQSHHCSTGYHNQGKSHKCGLGGHTIPFHWAPPKCIGGFICTLLIFGCFLYALHLFDCFFRLCFWVMLNTYCTLWQLFLPADTNCITLNWGSCNLKPQNAFYLVK